MLCSDGEGATARTYVYYVSYLFVRAYKRPENIYKSFGFGAGYEDAFIYIKITTVELHVTSYIGEGLMVKPSLYILLKLTYLTFSKRLLRVCQEVSAIFVQYILKDNNAVQPSRRYTMSG